MNLNQNFILLMGIILFSLYSVQLVPNCVDIPFEELTDEEPDTTFTQSDLLDIFSKLRSDGYLIVQTVGESMRGTINPNQRCLCIPKDDYVIGDIVLFIDDGTGISHEIVYLTQTGFITKGTNNDFVDSEIDKSQILCSIGKVSRYKLW